ncbi:hypothetical protein [Vibrio alginolyticus]|uniref:hypothetical protein n=1 Tax=Vibrio alginolyticus TaxID=663 RepID=UPI0035C6C386
MCEPKEKRINKPKLIAKQESEITLLRNQVRNMTICIDFLGSFHKDNEAINKYVTNTVDNAMTVLKQTYRG